MDRKSFATVSQRISITTRQRIIIVSYPTDKIELAAKVAVKE